MKVNRRLVAGGVVKAVVFYNTEYAAHRGQAAYLRLHSKTTGQDLNPEPACSAGALEDSGPRELSGALGRVDGGVRGRGSVQRPRHRLQSGCALCSSQQELRAACGSDRLGGKLWAKAARWHTAPSPPPRPLGCQLWLPGFQTPLAPGLPSSHLLQSAPRSMPAGPTGQGPLVGVPLLPFRVSSAPLPLYFLLMRRKREGGREGNYIHT